MMCDMRFVSVVILALLLASPALAETITVAAAVSLRDALGEIARQYESETSHEARFIFGSSGQLMAQVRNGAPIDLFISAAGGQIDDLLKQDLVLEPTRTVIAGNTLVLIVPADARAAPARFADLADPRHRRIAIGEPKTVPAGEYAMQLLRSLKLDDAVAKRAIHGTNVRQVLSYVERGEVDAGIVYLTDALESGGDKVRVIDKADAKLHDPIRYSAIVVKASKHQAATRRFLEYLAKEPARRALKGRGFTIPDRKPPRGPTP
jgi:molybdate transport system substrate-binding protein